MNGLQSKICILSVSIYSRTQSLLRCRQLCKYVKRFISVLRVQEYVEQFGVSEC